MAGEGIEEDAADLAARRKREAAAREAIQLKKRSQVCHSFFPFGLQPSPRLIRLSTLLLRYLLFSLPQVSPGTLNGTPRLSGSVKVNSDGGVYHRPLC